MNSAEESEKSSALPAFLAYDPNPSVPEGRPTTSSSNATSEFDATRRHSNVSGLTGPVGEPGLPPSRPLSTDLSEQTQPQTAQRPSVRGSYTSPPSRRGNRGDGGSRPTSAVGQTHVPSLAAQGFFRPMSPQLLQAQRSSQGISSTAGSRVQSPVPAETVTEEKEPYYEPGSRIESAFSRRDGRFSPTAGLESPTTTYGGASQDTRVRNSNGYQSTSAGGQLNKANDAPVKTMNMPDQQKSSTKNKTSPPKSPKSPKSLRASLGWGSTRSSFRNGHDRKPSKSHKKLHSTPQSPVDAFDEKKPVSSANRQSGKASGRNYEYFAGNMLFFCSGRLLNTKASPLNVATFILTALPAVLFFAFSAPWLWHNVSPAIPIIFAYFFFISISAFLHAAFSDPGILPRNLHPHPPNPDEERDPLTVGPATTEWIMVKTFPTRQKQDGQSNAENGQAQTGPTTAMEVPTKFCKSCEIWRPPRAHHCRTCDACIETQDHHCVWLNNCVGRRNYRFFFAYVGFSSILAILLLAFSALHISHYADKTGISFGRALSGRTQERVAFAMLIYSILALPYPGSLFVYHLFLVSRGETTREYLNSHKFPPKDRHRPFSQPQFLSNWRAVLMRPRPPSYMSFKRHYTEGDTRFGHIKRRKDRKDSDRLETARRDSRVKGLKNRFSVPHTGNGSLLPQQNGKPLEMKQMPASPNGRDKPATATMGSRTPGNMNSTPR